MGKNKPESKKIVTKRKFKSPIRTYEVTLGSGAVFLIKATEYSWEEESAYFDIQFEGIKYIRVAEFKEVYSIIMKDDLTTELADCMELKETVQ